MPLNQDHSRVSWTFSWGHCSDPTWSPTGMSIWRVSVSVDDNTQWSRHWDQQGTNSTPTPTITNGHITKKLIFLIVQHDCNKNPGRPSWINTMFLSDDLQTTSLSTIYRSVEADNLSSFLACNSRLRSAIRRHHPPQRAVLSHICCFGERKMVMFQILLDGAEPCDVGTTQLSSPVCRRGGQQDPLGRQQQEKTQP